MKIHYIAMVPNYWGRGPTPEEAKKTLKRHSGKLKGCVVFRVSSPSEFEPFVDELGRIVHALDATVERLG